MKTEINELKELIANQEGVLPPDTIDNIQDKLDEILETHESKVTELEEELSEEGEKYVDLNKEKDDAEDALRGNIPIDSLLDEMKMEVIRNIFANASIEDLNRINAELKATNKHYKEVIL